MIRLQIPRIIMLILTMIVTTIVVQAAVPNTMNYQGRLTNNQGQPVNGTVSMTFTIYDAETDGDSKWIETHPSVSVIDGLFSVVLGQGSPAVPIEDTVFTRQNRWLEVAVNGETIVPRSKLTSGPYAFQAGWTLIDNVLYTSETFYGIARKGNVLLGAPETHVNLGIYSCTTGVEGNSLSDFCTVGGGGHNIARPGTSYTEGGATVSGGLYNKAEGMYCTVSGGVYNTARAETAGNGFSTVAGGYHNLATGRSSVVGGGQQDTATGHYSMVPGGRNCTASGRYSFAAGRHAKALHDGSFVWADTTDEDIESTAPNQFLIRASGGVGISDELHFGDNSRDFFIKEVKSNDPAPWSDFITYDGIGIGSFNGGNQQVLLLADGSGGQNVLVFATTTDGGTTWEERLSIDHEGDVGIGTEWAGEELTVEGDICYTNSIYQCSDARYKKNIKTVEAALDKIAKLRGVTYNWRKEEFPNKKFDDGEHIGFIAQEIKDILPNVITTDDNGYMSVDYSRVTPLLVEAVKELKAENDTKQTEINDLRAKVVQLSTQMETVLAKIDNKKQSRDK